MAFSEKLNFNRSTSSDVRRTMERKVDDLGTVVITQYISNIIITLFIIITCIICRVVAVFGSSPSELDSSVASVCSALHVPYLTSHPVKVSFIYNVSTFLGLFAPPPPSLRISIFLCLDYVILTGRQMMNLVLKVCFDFFSRHENQT